MFYKPQHITSYFPALSALSCACNSIPQHSLCTAGLSHCGVRDSLLIQADCVGVVKITSLGLQGVFLTTLSFAEEGMAFTPDRNAVLDVLNNNSIEGSITLTQAAPRLLFMRGFSHFFEGKPSGLNPVSIVK